MFCNLLFCDYCFVICCFVICCFVICCFVFYCCFVFCCFVVIVLYLLLCFLLFCNLMFRILLFCIILVEKSHYSKQQATKFHQNPTCFCMRCLKKRCVLLLVINLLLKDIAYQGFATLFLRFVTVGFQRFFCTLRFHASLCRRLALISQSVYIAWRLKVWRFCRTHSSSIPRRCVSGT